MTVSYLVAYFFTPTAFRFDIPILNITFAQLVEIAWICTQFFLITEKENALFMSFLLSVRTVYVSSNQY